MKPRRKETREGVALPGLKVKRSSLERESEAELNLALGQDCVVNPSTAAPVDSCGWAAELRPVEEIENPCPELHGRRFSDVGLLGHRQVEIGQTGCDQGVPSHIPQGSGS